MVCLVLQRSDSEHSPGIKPSCPCILLALRDCREFLTLFFLKREFFTLSVSFKRMSLTQQSHGGQNTLCTTVNSPWSTLSHLLSYFKAVLYVYFLINFYRVDL